MRELPGLASDTAGAKEPSLRRPSKFRHEEARLARYSRRLADSESQLVTTARLAEAVNEFIKWRAFSYWLRLVVEAEASFLRGLLRSFDSDVRDSWSTRPHFPRNVRLSHSFFGFASWSGRTTRFLKPLQARVGGMRLAIMRPGIRGWINFVPIGNSAGKSGPLHHLRFFHALIFGARRPFRGFDRTGLLNELRDPRYSVPVKRSPPYVFLMTCQERLQRFFTDAPVLLPAE